MTFSVSGVETAFWVPPLVGLIISFFTSMGGLSGAFLILPFQVSVLGFTSPAVTPTNLVFNIVGIPSGVYRYFSEGRMNWPLAWNIAAGTFPGLFLGMIIRIVYLPDPRPFKLFAGLVLLYIGVRMLHQIIVGGGGQESAAKIAEARMREKAAECAKRKDAVASRSPAMCTLSWSLSRTEYEFFGERFSFHTTGLFFLSLVVGLIGGIYGIGGGAMIVPFIVTFFHLPVHTIAGAALMGTCVTSIFGVIFYSLIGPHFAALGESVSPDWALGFLFGIGGAVGMYLGAAAQKYVRAAVIRPALAILITGVGLQYAVGYFW
ncbi:MAG TPA: TSUP family transporter [Desulfomonilaceae bacterium]|nr:TSUP family transporter [Desulfomonilaceae bacterium]